jgi:hypothetical protein
MAKRTEAGVLHHSETCRSLATAGCNETEARRTLDGKDRSARTGGRSNGIFEQRLTAVAGTNCEGTSHYGLVSQSQASSRRPDCSVLNGCASQAKTAGQPALALSVFYLHHSVDSPGRNLERVSSVPKIVFEEVGAEGGAGRRSRGAGGNGDTLDVL